MKPYLGEQTIGQLEPRKGGYYYLRIEADLVNQYPNRRHTRLICTLAGQLTFRCGLNHLGDGHYYLILASKNLAAINKKLGDLVQFELRVDPDPLGVDLPEVLACLLEQDPDLKREFDQLSLGKQRSVIFAVQKIKDLDRQVAKTVAAIRAVSQPRRREK
jgi:hypothetical protein